MEIHKGHFRDQQSVCAVHHNQSDNRYDEFKEVTKAAQADRDDLAERQERTDIRISDSIEHIQEQIDTNYQRLWAFTEDVEKQLSQTL